MGGAVANAAVDSETALLLPNKPPKDPFNFTYITYFSLGVGFLLPWISFGTAIDYFFQIYPQTHVNRIFAVVYMFVALISLILVIFFTPKSNARIRINVGFSLFVLSLLVVPLLEVFYIRGRVGLYNGFYVTIGAVVLCGVADALVQGGIFGCAGELPVRYMQALVSGTAASGVIMSVMRIITKAIYPQDPNGLRQSAILYFAVAIAIMIICTALYNVDAELPVAKHYENLKKESKDKRSALLIGSIGKSTLWEIISTIKIYAFGVVLVFMVSQSIFPGPVTEDVHSEFFKDWYPIFLCTVYSVFDLCGKYFPSLYMLENPKVFFGSCVGRLLFYPLFLGCLHGPLFLRTEVLVAILTSLLGFSHGYLSAVALISAPKLVSFEYAEISGVVMVLFLLLGLVMGSVAAWFWIL